MESHIARVQALGNYLYQNHQKDFPLIDIKILKAFLGLHDQSKINMSTKFLHTHQIDKNSVIIEKLYSVYALPYEQLSPQQQGQMEHIIQSLNRVDANVRQEFFQKHGLLLPDGSVSDAGKQYQFIEKIADVVDRGEAAVSVEEFHGRMTKASVFLRDFEEQKFTKILEKKYAEITKGLEFETFHSRRMALHSCDTMYSRLLLTRVNR